MSFVQSSKSRHVVIFVLCFSLFCSMQEHVILEYAVFLKKNCAFTCNEHDFPSNRSLMLLYNHISLFQNKYFHAEILHKYEFHCIFFRNAVEGDNVNSISSLSISNYLGKSTQVINAGGCPYFSFFTNHPMPVFLKFYY